MEPLLLSTWSFGLRAHAEAWPDLLAGGSAVDAAERVCCVTEADPDVDSVGYGGLPDASGRITLDAAMMVSPDRCGAVAAVSGYRHVASIARRVMDETRTVLLVGDGADRFAAEHGFTPAHDLLTPDARAAWERWRAKPNAADQSRDRGSAPPPRPIDTGSGRLFRAEGDAETGHDTIGVIARDRDGVVTVGCSTSGTPFKEPGRVGDCPIIGHGIYAHPKRGAAVATGSGELMMRQCAAFLIVEWMARGAAPRDALLEALRRIAAEHALGRQHQAAFIALAPDGTWSSAALRDGFRACVTTPDRNEVVEPETVLLDEAFRDPHDMAK